MTVIAIWDGLDIDPALLSALGGYGYNVTVTYDGQDQPRFLAYINAGVNAVASNVTAAGSSETAAAASASAAATSASAASSSASTASTQASNAAASASSASTSASNAASSATSAAASATAAAGYVVPSQPGNSGKFLTTDGSNTSWGALSAASDTAAGTVELATNAETQTGTDAVRAVTPAALASVTATETRAGLVELATTAEAQTGTDTARATTPAGVAAAIAYAEDAQTFALSDQTTAITTGTAKVTWRAPFALTLTRIPRAWVKTASSSGLVTVDINEGGTSVLGASKLSIDANEKTSTTAATATTLADTAIADDAEITFDVDAAGTGAVGLGVTLYYRRA